MATTFHPQVYRGASSSPNNVASPSSSPSSSSSSSSFPSTSTNNARRAQPPQTQQQSTIATRLASPSLPTSTTSTDTLPTHGLQHNPNTFTSTYPLHPQSTPDFPIHLITADQYANLVYAHSQIKLQSESVLFPWLHGADVPDTAQAENFGFKRGDYQQVPRYRGLLTIAAHGPRGPDEEEEDEYENENEDDAEEYSSASSSSSSPQSCESVFVDPSLVKTEHEQGPTTLSSSVSPSLSTSASAASASASAVPPHVRNITSASIATSYSTDSFCSSCSASHVHHFCNSMASTSTSTSASNSSSAFSSAASSIYSISRTSEDIKRQHSQQLQHSHQHEHQQQCCGCACGNTSRSMTRESSVCMTEPEEYDDNDNVNIVDESIRRASCLSAPEVDTPPSSVVSSASSEHGYDSGRHPHTKTSGVQGQMGQSDGASSRSSSMSQDDGKDQQHRQNRQHRQRQQAIAKRPFGPEHYTSLLVNSHHPHEVLAYDSTYDDLRAAAIARAEAEGVISSSGSSTDNLSLSELDFDDAEAVCFQIHAIPCKSVSFRHFRLQKFKYATVSDVVVYHRLGSGVGSENAGGFDEAFEVARKVKVAQRKMLQLRRQRGEYHALEYNVFVIVDSFTRFERDFPHLVAVDSRSWLIEKNRINFVDKEHDEMRKLTRCSPIGENVYLGNTFDVPLPHPRDRKDGDEPLGLGRTHDEDVTARSDVSSSFLSSCDRLRRSPSLYSLGLEQDSTAQYQQQQHAAGAGAGAGANSPQQDAYGEDEAIGNVNKFSICIEARDMAAMCTTRNLRERERYLDDLQRQLLIERELASIRKTGLRSAPAAVPLLQTLAQQQQQQQQQTNQGANKKKKSGSARRHHHHRMQSKKRNNAFWFSSSSSSSSSYDDDDSSSSSASSDASGLEDEEAHSIIEEIEILPGGRGGRRQGDDEDMSDFDDFAGEDAAADITLSHSGLHRQQQQRYGRRSISPASMSAPPFGSSTSSTPIKLKYKQSKSLRIAREQEEAKRAADAAAAARALANCGGEGGKGSCSIVAPDVLEIATDEIVHMECLSTAQPFNQASVPAMVDSMLEYVVWLRTQARPHLRSSKDLQRACASAHQDVYTDAGSDLASSRLPRSQPCGALSSSASAPFEPMARRILIHCVDGYTDSSVLALAYIMYDRAISLPEAYLYLQNECNRSFFVYQSDMPFLTAIEKRIQLVVRSQGRERFNDDVPMEEQMAILEAERRERERLAEVTNAAAGERASSAFSAGLGRGVTAVTREMARSLMPRPGLFSRSSSKDSTSSTATMKAVGGSSNPGSPPPASSATFPMPRGPASRSSGASSLSPNSAAMQSNQSNGNAIAHAWFYDDRFDGHFPSRILDYLYLGNLGHATNALMLKELGITHVLSIGESALIHPSKQCAPSSPSSAARARTPTNSLWLEHSLGNITVMDIQDINDDGVDSILPHLVSGMNFIESARAAGGKCLVHCRVGVSRSATLVIGQVMKDLDMSLAEAYLMVRARRLNILIQPTVLFMHTLWTWEEQIRNSALIDDKGTPAFERSNRMCWPVLATEMANLNSKYLNC